jgi:hypothetical protein
VHSRIISIFSDSLLVYLLILQTDSSPIFPVEIQVHSMYSIQGIRIAETHLKIYLLPYILRLCTDSFKAYSALSWYTYRFIPRIFAECVWIKLNLRTEIIFFKAFIGPILEKMQWCGTVGPKTNQEQIVPSYSGYLRNDLDIQIFCHFEFLIK